MKFLLLVALLMLVGWLWSKKKNRPPQTPLPPVVPAERMVACSHCQVHLPESDALSSQGQFYCSEAHRQAGSASRP